MATVIVELDREVIAEAAQTVGYWNSEEPGSAMRSIAPAPRISPTTKATSDSASPRAGRGTTSGPPLTQQHGCPAGIDTGGASARFGSHPRRAPSGVANVPRID